MYWVLCSRLLSGFVELMSSGSTIDHLYQETFLNMPYLKPPLERQRAIATFLDVETRRIQDLVEQKRRTIALVEERWRTSVRATLRELAPVIPLKRKWRVIDCKHRTPTYVDDGYPVVSPGDLMIAGVDVARCHRFVDELDFVDLTEGGRRPSRGDVIYSRNASAGVAAFVDTDEPFCMGQDVCLITSQDQDQRFLAYSLNALGADQLEPLKIGTTITRINVDQIGELDVPAPPVEMQRQTADALERESRRSDELAGKLRRQIDLLREHRQALITAAVTGQLDVSEAAA
jgi:type I restriction enzyme S subunit